MTSRERVYKAIRGEKTDKTPRFIWVGDAARAKLCAGYGISGNELDKLIGNDVLQAWLSINREMERPAAEGERFIDEWGITWERQGYYNMVVRHPLNGMSLDEIKAYPVPGLFAHDRFAAFDKLQREHGGTHFIGADVSGTIFEPAYHLRGMEELLMDIASESEEADAILDMTAEHSKKIALEALNRRADWIWLGDDMGTQNDMIMSPALWRRYFKPRMKNIIDALRKQNPDIIIAYHSCGAISRILPELIEIGIDVINPLQESAAGMAHSAIRAMLGDKATMFCGPDTQTFLINATPDEVRAATCGMLARLGANGRYIFGLSHTLQPDVPPENVKAMLEALE